MTVPKENAAYSWRLDPKENINDKEVLGSLGIDSVFTSLSYFTTFPASWPQHGQPTACTWSIDIVSVTVKWTLTTHLAHWGAAGWPLGFQILPFSESFYTCSLILSLKGNLLPTTVWTAFLINNACCVMRTIKAKVKNVKHFNGMSWWKLPITFSKYFTNDLLAWGDYFFS